MSEPTSRRQVCAFCRHPADVGRRVVQAARRTDASICESCLNEAVEALRREDPPASGARRAVPTPEQIKARLDEYVVGQERAKRVLAVAVYQHYRRVEHNDRGGDIELGKSNILMIGPTGSGKTLLAEVLARILEVPFAIYDSTSLTEAGYVGEDVENVLLRLFQSADGDITRAERGIVYLDEIDKIGRKAPNPSITRDVNGEGVQQALLKIVEGTLANVPKQGGRKHPTQEYVQMDTRNILFICGGTFDGLEQIHERGARGGALGFRAPAEALPRWFTDERVLPRDLVDYGMIPELVGRLPVVVGLDELREDELVRILDEPRNALLRQYARRIELDGGRLEVSERARRALAQLALQRGMGARGLRSLVEQLLSDTLYALPGMGYPARIVVDEAAVRGRRRVRVLRAETRPMAGNTAEVAA